MRLVSLTRLGLNSPEPSKTSSLAAPARSSSTLEARRKRPPKSPRSSPGNSAAINHGATIRSANFSFFVKIMF